MPKAKSNGAASPAKKRILRGVSDAESDAELAAVRAAWGSPERRGRAKARQKVYCRELEDASKAAERLWQSTRRTIAFDVPKFQAAVMPIITREAYTIGKLRHEPDHKPLPALAQRIIAALTELAAASQTFNSHLFFVAASLNSDLIGKEINDYPDEGTDEWFRTGIELEITADGKEVVYA